MPRPRRDLSEPRARTRAPVPLPCRAHARAHASTGQKAEPLALTALGAPCTRRGCAHGIAVAMPSSCTRHAGRDRALLARARRLGPKSRAFGRRPGHAALHPVHDMPRRASRHARTCSARPRWTGPAPPRRERARAHHNSPQAASSHQAEPLLMSATAADAPWPCQATSRVAITVAPRPWVAREPRAHAATRTRARAHASAILARLHAHV